MERVQIFLNLKKIKITVFFYQFPCMFSVFLVLNFSFLYSDPQLWLPELFIILSRYVRRGSLC